MQASVSLSPPSESATAKLIMESSVNSLLSENSGKSVVLMLSNSYMNPTRLKGINLENNVILSRFFYYV